MRHTKENTPIYKDTHRAYRQRCHHHDDECTVQVVVAETDLHITLLRSSLAKDGCDDARSVSSIENNDATRSINVIEDTYNTQSIIEDITKYICTLRGQIEAWCALQPEFRYSLTPVSVPNSAPDIIQRMAHGSQLMGVGPFAAVAGTIAQMVAEEFHKQSEELIIENGGDIYIYTGKERIIGILAQPDDDGGMIGIMVKPQSSPVSLCASSAYIGHSLSFGHGDVAVIRSKNASLADSAATFYCNMLKTGDDVARVINHAKGLEHLGITGIYAQCCGQIGIWGDMELAAV